MFFLHLLCRPKKEIQIDIIAANEIPFTRALVVLTQLSLLSYINGILIDYQIDSIPVSIFLKYWRQFFVLY